MPTLTSSTGGADRETRIVSPMPLLSRAPNAVADLMVPWNAGPASVTPRCRGQSPRSESSSYARTMTTGSLCLTEILKSWKPCSSNSDASHTADSTSASGVALPYLASSRGSSDPALTPIRSDTPASDAARAISFTWSSNLRMLPGLTRTAAQPASIAAKTYFGWKWMSAITGICDLCAIAGRASASSDVGTATRTMSQPAAVSSAICWSVALMSVVCVVHMDWTLTGASPPTSTLPTRILRVGRRGARTGAGASGMPRLIGMLTRPVSPVVGGAPPAAGRRHRTCTTRVLRPRAEGCPARPGGERAARAPGARAAAASRGEGGSAAEVHRVDDVRVDEQRADADQQGEDAVGERHHPGDVHGGRPGQAAEPGQLPLGSLPQRADDVAAVQRQQR